MNMDDITVGFEEYLEIYRVWASPLPQFDSLMRVEKWKRYVKTKSYINIIKGKML